MKILSELMQDQLIWLPEIGIGYYPVKDSPYNDAYFENYQKITNTDIGKQLNNARINLVNRYTSDKVLDIGIGSGVFVINRPNTFGYDINPAAVKWLNDQNKFLAPEKINAMTFWDSLEHIHDPSDLLSMIENYAFVSCPIYKDAEHIKKSKHFKKSEHCWYWTIEGLCRYMNKFGFECVEFNWQETNIGREDIGAFVFKKNR